MYRGFHHRLLKGTALASAMAATLASGSAMAEARTFRFDIPAESLSDALRDYGRATRQQLIFTENLTAGHKSPALRGELSADAALDRLLADSGLSGQRTDAGALIISATRGGRGPQPQAATVPEKDLVVDELIVTARSRRERLQDVPLSITALDSKLIEHSGVQNLRGISFLTPGLTMQSPSSEFFSSPVIRGMSNSSAGGSENNTSVFFNGNYIAVPSAINLGLTDIERIEVVKGPGGALYGRNSFAGAINYVTRTPTDDPSARLETLVGSDGKAKVTGVVNGPLIPGVLRARGALTYDKFGGTWKDPVNGARMGDYKKLDGQVALNYTPTDKATLDATFYYGDDKFGVPAHTYLDNNCALRAGLLRTYCGVIPDGQDVANKPQRPAIEPSAAGGNDRKVIHTDFKAGLDLGWGTLSVLGGYNDIKTRALNEFNGRRDGLFYPLVPGPGLIRLNAYSGSQNNSIDYSLESSIASKRDQPLRWKIGGFYFSQDNDLIGDNSANADLLPAGQTLTGTIGLWLSPGAAPSAANSLSAATDRQESGFGQLEYDLTSKITATADARYTHEAKTIDIIRNYTLPGVVRPVGPKRSADWGFWDFRGTLNYKPSANMITYASVASGTKAGGFNTNATIASEVSFDPETNWTYEVGVKSAWLDGRVRGNLALYYTDWKDLQIAGVSSSGAFITKNYGTIHNRGGEIDVAVKLAEGVTLSGGGAYTDPIYQGDSLDYFGASTCVLVTSCAGRVVTINGVQAVSLKGLQRIATSPWQFSLSLDVDRPLTADMNWLLRADYGVKSKEYTDLDNLRYVQAEKMLNARVGIRRGSVEVTAFVDNLLDSLIPSISGGGTRLDTFVSEQRLLYPERRTWGLSAVARF